MTCVLGIPATFHSSESDVSCAQKVLTTWDLCDEKVCLPTFILDFYGKLVGTPRKTNMEPKNYPIEKENHL